MKTCKPSVLLRVLGWTRYHSHKDKTFVEAFCPSSPHPCFVFLLFYCCFKFFCSYALSNRRECCTLPTTCANFYLTTLYQNRQIIVSLAAQLYWKSFNQTLEKASMNLFIFNTQKYKETEVWIEWRSSWKAWLLITILLFFLLSSFLFF